MIPKQEDKHTEFKSSFSEKVIIGLVAFANAKGGTVYIGVDDDGSIVGARLGKETIAQWINEVKSKTEPSIIPDVEIMEENGKTIVMFSVQEYPVKPVSVKGKYYCRRQNSNHLLSAGEIADMSLQTRNSSWDYYPDPLHTVDDLNFNLVKKSIAQMNRRGMNITETPKEYILKKGLCHADGKLTFGGYLLFKQEEDILTTIELGHFQDKDGIFIKDSARSKSSLVEQVDEVMQFVKKHINMAVIISPNQVENIQKWDYPLDAIREIVLNMIVHRDYRAAADSIVKILPDRMEFYNPGKLPEGMDVEKLLSNHYRSQPRNKQIADVFKDMGEIEKYGSGIRRVIQAFLEAGHKAPEWQQISGGIMVTVHLDTKNETENDLKGNLKDNLKSDLKDNLKDDLKSDLKNLSPNQRKIMELIKSNNMITQAELSSKIGISPKNIRNNIAFLKQNGLIVRVGTRKNGHWEVMNETENDLKSDLKDNLKDDLKSDLKNLSPNQRKIMELIKSNNMITQAELSSKIGISPKNIRNNIAFLKQNGLIVRVGTRKNGHWEVTENFTENDGINGGIIETVGKTMEETVGETVEIILNLIINNPKITKPEIAKLTGLSLRGVEWNIQQLKSTGRLTRIGPNKGGHWEVKTQKNE